MTKINSNEALEKQPKMVDVFSAEMEKRLKNEGQMYQRKIEPIRGAKQIVEAQTVETNLPDGMLETSVDAKPGDWIITGADGEKYVISSKRVDDLFQFDGKDGLIPREHKVIALKNPFGELVKISAPWGTPENPMFAQGSDKCYFVVSLDEDGNFTNSRYIIGDKELLLSNYDPVL